MNNFIGNFVGFDGRLNRQPFWLSAVALGVVSVIISLVLLPIIGFSVMPDLSVLLDGSRTPEEVAAFMRATQIRANWISLVLFLVFLYPSAAICIKRRHDRNSNGLDVWIYFALAAIMLLLQALGIGMTVVEVAGTSVPVPGPITGILLAAVGIMSIYLFIVLGFLKGTVGPNAYGADPLQG